jgi:homoserine kinase
VHIVNPIPLGRGLGSSGAAVVGGVALGNEIGKLGLSKARMLVSGNFLDMSMCSVETLVLIVLCS